MALSASGGVSILYFRIHLFCTLSIRNIFDFSTVKLVLFENFLTHKHFKVTLCYQVQVVKCKCASVKLLRIKFIEDNVLGIPMIKNYHICFCSGSSLSNYFKFSTS